MTSSCTNDTPGPFYEHGLTLISGWISNHMPVKCVMTLPIHSQILTVVPWYLVIGKWFHPTLYDGCNYLCMLGLKFIHVSKGGPSINHPSDWAKGSLLWMQWWILSHDVKSSYHQISYIIHIYITKKGNWFQIYFEHFLLWGSSQSILSWLYKESQGAKTILTLINNSKKMKIMEIHLYLTF